MNKIIAVLLIISLIGNIIGLYFAYRFLKFKGRIENMQESLDDAAKIISDLTDKVEANVSKRMVFLHHSVGKGILQQGGLRDSLLAIGISVKGATYGDEVGQFTDMCHWSPKFANDFDRILDFKNHPNVYYQDGRSNDIIMFKSCFPNSFITGEGSGPGDPTSRERTLQNYKASFAELGKVFRQHPDRLFIYMTFPPLTTAETNPEAAKRAREFNNWLLSKFLPQYRQESGLDNFQIFDLFDILADSDNVLRREFHRDNEHDSHPNETGNKIVAQKFMEFFRPVWNQWENKSGTQAAAAKAALSS